MREQAVEAAFVTYLLDRVWDVTTNNADHTDVIGKRGAELLVAEVKGHTSQPGLDIDTGYGQLLRRVSSGDVTETAYALVVPETLLDKATRVDTITRERLNIHIYLVNDLGGVRRLE